MLLRLFVIVALFVIPLCFTGCRSEDPEEIWELDRNKILEYIAIHSLTAIEHTSGIFYVVDVEGSGPHPTLNSRVNVKYTGMLLDGTIFDASGGTTFTVGNTIQGWQIGIPLFRAGGKGKLLIPSALGYGANPPGGIPRNAPLVFDIEIIELRN